MSAGDSEDTHTQAGFTKTDTGDLARSGAIIGLILAACLFNFGFWYLAAFLQHTYNAPAKYLGFVVFLTFALSVAVILRVALSETVDTTNIENEWLKRIGITPSLMIVAVLVSLLLQFSGFDVLPSYQPRALAASNDLKYVKANVGIGCWVPMGTEAQKDNQEAPAILTLISSDNPHNIANIRTLLTHDELNSKEAVRYVKANDDYYKLIKSSASLREATFNPDNWFAYTVPANDPGSVTRFSIPMHVDSTQTTRILIVSRLVPQARIADTSDPLSSGSPLISAVPAPQLSIRHLLDVKLAPQSPKKDWQHTELEFRVHPHPNCWIKASH